MAGPTPTQPSVDEPTPIPGSLGAVCRTVATWAIAQRPSAVECEIIVRHLDKSGRKLADTLAVPLEAPLPEELPDRILAVLGKLQPGQWLGGKALAAEVEIDDPGSGSFRRAMAILKGKVESNTNLGYRLAKG